MRIAARHQKSEWRIAAHEFEARPRLVRVGGEWIDVIRMGQGDPLVLVPGLAGGWKLLAPLASRLAKHYEVIIPGFRGDRFPLGSPGPHEMGDLADDLENVIDLLGLECPAVFGVSFGAAVALELAVHRPNRIGALILSGVESKFRSNLGTTIARRVLERFPLPSDNNFVNQFFNLLHGGKPDRGLWSEFVVEHCWETDQAVMARRIGLLESFDVSDRLWRVDVPTLVLAGSRDAIVPPNRQRAMAAAIPGARFESLEGAGHVGFLTHGAEVSRHVRGLLRQLARASRGHDSV